MAQEFNQRPLDFQASGSSPLQAGRDDARRIPCGRKASLVRVSNFHVVNFDVVANGKA